MSAPLTTIRQREGAVSLSSRFADYLEITKPRISVMVLITVCVGYALGSFGVWNVGVLLHALFGISLVATASSL